MGFDFEIKKKLTVGELKKIIKNLPDDMVCITSRYSDFDSVDFDEPKVIEAVDKECYIMRPHKTMNPDLKKTKYFFMCDGN